MILIADSGSTKTHWAALHAGEPTEMFFTGGFNPMMLSDDEMCEYLRTELLVKLAGRCPDEIWFYGAGCIPKACPRVADALTALTGCCKVSVNSDMLGAARALCGRQRGIACILGTGSNSCCFDGERITHQVSPLGYILGDEGSGAVLGRRLVGDVLKGQLPADIRRAFREKYRLTRTQIIARVYRESAANKFLASFAPFLGEHIDRVEIDGLVTDEFVRFIQRNLSGYPRISRTPVHFTGSIAYRFEPQLRKAAELTGVTIGSIVREPIYGLIEYHSLDK